MIADLNIGIRGRLFAAFGIVVGMTLTAAAVGWIVFTRLGDNFEQFVAKNIPAVTLTSQLAESGTTIIGTAPTLAMVINETERQRVWELLSANLDRMNELYRNSGDLVSGEVQAQAGATLDSLTANLHELDENVRRGLWYRTQKEELSGRLRWSLADFLGEMEPMIDDIHFNIEQILKSDINGESRTSKKKNLENEVALQQAFFRINAGGSLLAGLIGGGAYLPDHDDLAATELYVREVEANLKEDLEIIKNVPGSLALTQSLLDILDFAHGSRSLIQMRDEELLVIEERDLLLAKSLALENRLQKLITEAVQKENRTTLKAAADSRKAIRHGKLFLALATVVSLFVALCIVWCYVGGNLVSRITRLDRSMRRIAEGDLASEIIVTGNDEIGAMAGSLKSFRDTLQQTQHELAQAGKLALLGQLSAGIGHELNQPLGAIRHYARNGKLFLDQQRVDEARSNLEKIARLTERARRIIERLRSMARKPGQELSRIDLLGAVDNVLTLLDHRMEKMGVEVELDIDEPNRYVAAGQLRLEQLLLNLLNNGLDAMADTENPRIKISSADDDGHIELLVSDSGHGVAAENIERIFDPFFSTKEVGRGVGIGLSISYNIVKDFGGTIRCESVPEKGAVFRISLERR